jgi:pSer/pThr/pTyr-binding forkhead associated (FHA) protein
MEKTLILQSTDISNKLIQEWDLDAKEYYYLLPRTYCIGRNIDKSNIVINDSTISRVHAELSFKYPKIFLKDLGSGNYLLNLQANGTLVNGKQIEKYVAQEISLGSSFILGDSKILLKVLGLILF